MGRRRTFAAVAAAVAAAAGAGGCGGDRSSATTRAAATAAAERDAGRMRLQRSAELGSAAARRLARRAAAYRRSTEHGLPVGRIRLPRDPRETVVLAGLDQATIDRRPGWYERSHLPGEGRLIYLAGHNRTHGGPFGALPHVRRGDPIVLALPYATAAYAVISRRQESERDVGLLRSGRRELLRLQTSTDPPSRRRWIIDARLIALTPVG